MSAPKITTTKKRPRASAQEPVKSRKKLNANETFAIDEATRCISEEDSWCFIENCVDDLRDNFFKGSFSIASIVPHNTMVLVDECAPTKIIKYDRANMLHHLMYIHPNILYYCSACSECTKPISDIMTSCTFPLQKLWFLCETCATILKDSRVPYCSNDSCNKLPMTNKSVLI